MKFLISAIFLSSLSFSIAAEIYTGEPLGEALYDLSGSAVLIAHDLTTASPLKRVDIFKLHDTRLLAITSEVSKIGEPYSVKAIQVSDSKGKPTKDTEKISPLVIKNESKTEQGAAANP